MTLLIRFHCNVYGHLTISLSGCCSSMGGSVGLWLSLILPSSVESCLSVGGAVVAAAVSLLSSALVYSVWRSVMKC